jgi:hypothetical protein
VRLNAGRVENGKDGEVRKVREAIEDVPDLYWLAFTPGVFRCPLCNLHLTRMTAR